jgi:hypothetical protein
MAVPPSSISGRWVHEFERDSGSLRFFVREGAPLARSRRPREIVEIRDDGTVSRLKPGPADARLREEGTWEARGDGTVVLRLPGAAGAETFELAGATAAELQLRTVSDAGPNNGGDGD